MVAGAAQDEDPPDGADQCERAAKAQGFLAAGEPDHGCSAPRTDAVWPGLLSVWT